MSKVGGAGLPRLQDEISRHPLALRKARQRHMRSQDPQVESLNRLGDRLQIQRRPDGCTKEMTGFGINKRQLFSEHILLQRTPVVPRTRVEGVDEQRRVVRRLRRANVPERTEGVAAFAGAL